MSVKPWYRRWHADYSESSGRIIYRKQWRLDFIHLCTETVDCWHNLPASSSNQNILNNFDESLACFSLSVSACLMMKCDGRGGLGKFHTKQNVRSTASDWRMLVSYSVNDFTKCQVEEFVLVVWELNSLNSNYYTKAQCIDFVKRYNVGEPKITDICLYIERFTSDSLTNFD